MAYDPSRASPVKEPKAQSDITLDALLDEFEVSDPAVRDRVLRLAGVESNGNLNATGPRVNGGMHNGTRARGALQIMPATARAYPQYDLNDPADASRAGLHYFLDNLNQFGGDLDAATIAHHAGPGTAKKWLREGRAGTVDRATGLSTDDYLLKVAGGKRAKPADKWWEGDPVAPAEAAGNWWESDPVEPAEEPGLLERGLSAIGGLRKSLQQQTNDYEAQQPQQQSLQSSPPQSRATPPNPLDAGSLSGLAAGMGPVNIRTALTQQQGANPMLVSDEELLSNPGAPKALKAEENRREMDAYKGAYLAGYERDAKNLRLEGDDARQFAQQKYDEDFANGAPTTVRPEASWEDTFNIGATQAGRGMARGFYATLESVGDMVGSAELSQYAGEDRIKQEEAIASSIRTALGKVPEKGFKSIVGDAIPTIISQGAPIAAAALATVATRNPEVGKAIISAGVLAPMGVQSYGNAYADGKQKGLALEDRVTYGVGTALAEVLPERISLGYIMDLLTKPLKAGGKKAAEQSVAKELAKRYFQMQGSELATEEITTVSQFLLDRYYTNPDLTLKDLQEQMIRTALVTPIATTALGAAGAAGTLAGSAINASQSDLASGLQTDQRITDAIARQSLDPSNAQMREVAPPDRVQPPQGFDYRQETADVAPPLDATSYQGPGADPAGGAGLASDGGVGAGGTGDAAGAPARSGEPGVSVGEAERQQVAGVVEQKIAEKEAEAAATGDPIELLVTRAEGAAMRRAVTPQPANGIDIDQDALLADVEAMFTEGGNLMVQGDNAREAVKRIDPKALASALPRGDGALLVPKRFAGPVMDALQGAKQRVSVAFGGDGMMQAPDVAQFRATVPTQEEVQDVPKAQSLATQAQEAGGQEGAARSSIEGGPASWVIRNKETGEAVMETFDRAKVDALNTKKYEAVPILQHLQEVNRGIKSTQAPTAPEQSSPAPAQTQAADKPKRQPPARKPDPVTVDRAQRNAEDLRAMAQDAGWAEEGGKLIRDAEGSASRTKWIPRAEWFMTGMESRPDVLAQHIEAAARGEWIPVKSARTIEGMVEWLDAQRGQATLDEDASMYDFEASFGDVLDVPDAREVAEFFDDAFGDFAEQSEADAMRAMGFTEEEIANAGGQTQAGAGGAETADARGTAEAGERAGEAGAAQTQASAAGQQEGLNAQQRDEQRRAQAVQALAPLGWDVSEGRAEKTFEGTKLGSGYNNITKSTLTASVSGGFINLYSGWDRIGSVAIAASMAPDAVAAELNKKAEAWAQDRKAAKEERAKPMLQSNGKPFPSEKIAAESARQRKLDMVPVEVDGGWGLAEKPVRMLNAEGRATDGKPIMPGDTFPTLSGRMTTPYPKQKGEKYASQWLIDNAKSEAESRGDDYNLRMFGAIPLLKGGFLTEADKDMMLMYLFEQQPDVVPGILKPLNASAEPLTLDTYTNADIAQREAEQAADDTKAQADRERDAVPFTLDMQSQAKPQGVQGGMFTFDGGVSEEAGQGGLKFSRKQNNDAEYLAAVERGDMEAAQRMVDQAARDAGYISDTEYRMQHRAPNRESDVSLVDLRDADLVPSDYWTKPEWYQGTPEEMRAWHSVTTAMRRMDAQKADGKNPGMVAITVYRAVPKGVKDGAVRNGDWVTPSREYAVNEGQMIPGGYRIIAQQALMRNLFWDGNSIAELGYDDGQPYAYRNTKNNRKLLEAVTYDDDGNVIPLSKRFNARSDDARFSFASQNAETADTMALDAAQRRIAAGEDAERRATAPSATADVADADVIVVFNGTEMQNAPAPANAPKRFTRSALVQSISSRFPSLTRAVESALRRGDEGKPGGVVVVERARDLAGTFASKTGRTMEEALDLLQMSQGAQAAPASLAEVEALWDARGIDNAISEKNGIITLHKIIVQAGQRERGVGTQAMRELIAYADRTGQQIALTPSSDFGGNKRRLEGFYRRLGFRTYKGFAVREKRIRDPEVLQSQNGDIQGFFDPKSGLTFMVAPNLTAETAPAVLFHEAMHGKQREEIDRKAMDLIETRQARSKPLRDFLFRVEQRMDAAGESGNVTEAAAYIVEEAVAAGRQAGFSAVDGKLMNWIDLKFGRRVSDIVRDFVAMIRAWAMRAGVELNPTVDDLVALAKLNVRDMARGDVTGGEGAKESRASQTASKAFRDWFGDSKAVDENGQPLVMYHGSPTPDALTEFQPGGGVGSRLSGDAYGVASYFTSSPGEASTYARDEGGAVLPVYLRGEILDLNGELTGDQRERLTRLANETLLPSDKARFEAGRKRRSFESREDAIEFFDSQRANWLAFGDGMDRARPDAIVEGDKFVVEYTDFDAEVTIETADQAATLLKAIGWDNLPAAGFDGVMMTRSGGAKWVVMHRPDGNVKSATGNNGNFDPTDRRINFSRAGHAAMSAPAAAAQPAQAAPRAAQARATPPDETRFQAFQRKAQDKLNRFTVIKEWLAAQGVTLSEQADVYKAEERMHSRFANKAEDFREKTVKPLVEKIQKAGYTMDDVAQYLHAQHAEERNIQVASINKQMPDGGSGMKTADANAILAAAPAELRRLANEFRAITERTKQILLDNGIISQDMADAWDATYQHYVPLKGGPEQGGKGAGKGLKANYKGRRALGHQMREEGEWIVENILADHERAIMLAEKNRIGQSLLKMAIEVGRDDLLTVGKPEKRGVLKNNTAYEVLFKGKVIGSFQSLEAARTFRATAPAAMRNASPSEFGIRKVSDPTVAYMASPMLADNEVNVYVKGQAIRVQINDELLARAYGNMGTEALGAILRVGATINGYFSKIYTGYNPEFILTNIVRDFTTGVANVTGEEGAMMALRAAKDYPASFADLFRYATTGNASQWIRMYREDGGNTGAAYLSDLERLGDEISTEYAAYKGVLANLKAGDVKSAARAAGRKAFDKTLVWVERINQAGENAMRLSIYKAMIESGKSRAEAASLAKNATVNFNRNGEVGRQMNALWLFYNAGVQGTAAIAHANLKGRHKWQARAVSAGILGLGYTMAVALGAGDDEDDYDKLSDYTKARNVVIKTGDGWLKIPVPYGYGFFWNVGRAIADAERKGEWGKAPWHVASSFIEEFTPFGAAFAGDDLTLEQVTLGALPTLAQIPASVGMNRTTMGGPMYPESAFDKYQPDNEKMWRATKGTIPDMIAQALDQGGIEVSPETIKYLTRTFTGGAGQFVTSIGDAAWLTANGASLEVKEQPFVRKFYTETDVREARSAYYAAVAEAEKAVREGKSILKMGDHAAYGAYRVENQEFYALDRMAKARAAAIKARRNYADAIRADKSLSVKGKRDKLKEAEAQEQVIYDRYLEVFKSRARQ